MPEQEKSTLEKLVATVSKLPKADQDKLLIFAEGAAFKAAQQEAEAAGHE